MAVRLVLVSTLALTLAVCADVLRRDELSARRIAIYLSIFTGLFLVRVVGQIVVWLRAPRWLPPMEEWNLVPYRLLLPVQLAFVAVMGAIVGSFLAAASWLEEVGSGLGRFLVGLSLVYAGAMCLRYALRMYRRPAARWFGGAIPIVYHVVLAAFLFTWGRYHVVAG